MNPVAGRVAVALEHHAAGRLAEAEAAYRDVLNEDPDNVNALHFLGVVALQRGAPAQAIELISRALERNPANAPACNNLGLALAAAGRRGEALRAILRAVALDANYADAFVNLRDLLAGGAAAHAPEERDALMALGEAYFRTNALDEASECMRRVLAADPAAADAHNLLGNVLRNQGLYREAMRHYELSMASDPAAISAFQNLLFCMLCSPGFSAADIHAKHREFARRFEAPLLAPRPFPNVRDRERRLRIGYVSPDFRDHVVGHYMQPIFEAHDRGRFEVHGYSATGRPDAVTQRLATLAAQWHDVASLSSEALAALVREHGIDVLVDLCGHGPGNRILAFARKPAPVQVSYLDYSATTGLASIDYRLSTAYCDPPGSAEPYYSEKLFRLPQTYWTYNPPLALPIRTPAGTGGVTFGSFNLYYRVTPEVLDVWCRVLQAVPGSRLLIVSVASGSTRERLLERISRAGIEHARVTVHGVVSYEAYHELIAAVDVALAPWPYNGATTTLDCLWNGVPVVAMQGGETFATRLACSVLDTLGLPDLIAMDADDYVRIAAALAAAPARRAELRATLRQRLERSPLRDFAGFTRALESAYRAMWRDWCAA